MSLTYEFKSRHSHQREGIQQNAFSFLHCKNTTTNIKEESTVLQLESERLTYREITEQDFEIVAGILRDPEVRRIWEQDFSDEEVWAWIARRQEGYRKSGIDYLLALDKATGQPVGQIGVLREEINGEKVWGVGYILRSDCRKKGYAGELIKAAIEDARKQGRKGLVLTCKDKLIHYYAKFGFVNEGVSQSVHGNVVWYQMRLTF